MFFHLSDELSRDLELAQGLYVIASNQKTKVKQVDALRTLWSVNHWFSKCSISSLALLRRQARTVGDGAFSNEIEYVAQV